MQEIGIESDMLEEILTGKKTIEGRLGTSKFIKMRVGDKISLREDFWKNGKIVKSIPNRAVVSITQLLYFETLEEMFSLVNFREVIPAATNVNGAINKYRTYYSSSDENEHGVLAIYFKLSS